MIVLEVPGQPVPQPRPRFSSRGGFGRAYTPKSHPVNAYRQAIVLMAQAKRLQPIAGPVTLSVDAVFERPPSHWRKYDLKPDAPAWPRADGDNILKAVADALTDAGVWGDDDQVVSWSIQKRFASRSQKARTVITFGEVVP